MVPLSRIGLGAILIAAAGCGGGGEAADAQVSPRCDAVLNGCGEPRGWRQRAAMPAPIQETAAVGFNDAVFVLGGFESGTTIVDKLQIYDVNNDEWTPGPALPAPAHHINAAVVDETIVVVGDLQTISFEPVGDVWTWSPGDAAWAVEPAMPRPRGSSVVGVVDGWVIVAGGLDPDGATAEVDAYDPSTGMWEARAPMPAPRDHACGGVIDGVLYVAGGRVGDPASPVDTVYAYDAAEDAWTERAPMLTGRGGAGCGVAYETLIVVGGEGNPDAPSGVFSEAERYNPATDAWTTLDPMPTPRHGMGAAFVDGELYVPGGANVTIFGAVATHEAYRP